ncbi:MAG TPA: creatininase family protein [Geminicoccaceae bacterium]|nr:creatininase family protein [Geminicoccus sp.]HMU51471.1 creatininase family protein [Geminicoccaceae bacterium]
MGKTLPAYWQDLASREFASLDAERTVALLPVAAIEQHGPHLPVSVDATINQGVVSRLLELAPAGTPLLVLPMQSVGKSDEHIAYPGTLTLTYETLIRVWTEIGASVARAGVRKLVLLNSHGGQIAPMQVTARELRIRQHMFAVAASWFAFGPPEGMFDADERRHGIHAGTMETAMMLALRPDLVRMDLARDFRPTTIGLAETSPRLASLGAAGFGWQAQDLHPSGACGDASKATAEMGRACIDHAAAALLDLVAEVSALSMSRLDIEPDPMAV